MTKNVTFVFESQVNLGVNADESAAPSGCIEAMLTTWGAREGADGRKFNYQPEPFKEWAKEFAATGKPLPMYFQHNSEAMPVGKWDEFEFTDEGMIGKGSIYVNTTAGKDIYTIMKESPTMIGGVSVGAYADEAHMVDENGNPLQLGIDSDEGYFQITKGGLREISVVMYPNNPAAEVMKLECFDAEGHLNPRIVEEALRDAGLSKKGAATASSVFKKILELRDADKEVVKETPQPSELEAVVNEADEILKALELREISKALSKRIK